MNPQAQSEFLEHLAESAQSQAALHAPAVVGLITGMILLLAGGRLLKPAVMLIGAAAGSLAGGLFIPALTTNQLGGVDSLPIGLSVGAIGGLFLAAMLFRFAMAAGAAAAFAGLALLATGVYLATSGELKTSLREDITSTEIVLAAHRYSNEVAAPLLTKDQATPVAVATRVFEQAGHDLSDLWNRSPGKARASLAGAGAIAGMIGLVTGLLMPRRAAAIVTGLIGAGVAIISLTWLAWSLNLPGREWLSHGPTGWLLIWIAVAAAGIWCQHSGAVAGKPAPA